MIVELEVLIEDKPGTLIHLLTPISENGCNIQGIYHGQKREDDNLIPVFVKFEVADKENRRVMEVIVKRYAELNIQIEKFAPIGLGMKEGKQKKRAVMIILDGAADLPLPKLGKQSILPLKWHIFPPWIG